MSTPIKGLWLVFTLFAGLASSAASACETVSEAGELRDGVYCLNADMDLWPLPFYLYDNATLDCQGHRIKDVNAAVSSAVIARGDNVVVKNCVIEGFHYQLRFLDTTNYRIEDNILVNARSYALHVTGQHGLIARNTIRNPASLGILISPLSSIPSILGANDVVGNTVILGPSPQPKSGIFVYSRGLIASNLVVLHPSPEQGGQAIASSQPISYRNVVVAAPGSFAAGLVCSGPGPYFQNVFLGFHPYDNTDAHCTSTLQTGLISSP